MIFEINKDDLELLKSVVSPNMFVITKLGLSQVLEIHKNKVLTRNKTFGDIYFNYEEIIPIMKGFQHLSLIDLFTIADLVSGRIGYGNYKPNYNFLPHFYEVTEESIDLKIQIYHNFDVVYCDNLLTNLGKVYSYLISKKFDIHNLQEKGLAIINPNHYGTNQL